MKTVSLILSVALIFGLVLSGNAYAGDAGWYVAGGFLGGLVASAIISDMARPRYYYPAYNYGYVRPVYCYRPVYNRYDTYRNYSYATSPYTSATVYEHEIVQTW